MPASTSSKISVAGARATLQLGADDRRSASAMRDSSPPDATLASGRGVAAGVAGDQELGRLDAERLRRVGRTQRDLEAAAGHAELLHRLRHRGGEASAPRRAARPRRGAPRRRRRRARRRSARSSASRSAAASSAAARPATARAAPAGRPAGGDGAAPAPPTADSRSSSSAQPLGIELGCDRGSRQACAPRPAAAPARLQRFDRAGEAQRRTQPRPAARRCARPASASALVVGLGRSRRARAAPHRSATGACASRRVLGVELGPFVGAGRELGDLADLPGRAARARARGRPASSRASGERLRSPRASADQSVGERRGVDAARSASSSARTAGARVRPCQACWPWMSTRQVGRLAQLRDRSPPLPLIHARLLPCASIVRRSSMRPASPVSASKPASASQRRERRRRVELGADLGARRAFAHDAGVAAAAERELQRVDQDRLAGAGLAAQHREAAASNSTSSASTMTKSRRSRGGAARIRLDSGVPSAACARSVA